MIHIEDLCICFESKKVLEGVNFSWDEKGIVMLCGANGAGKSTLLKSMMNLVSYEGSMMIDEKEIKQLSVKEGAAHFAYVAQQKMLPFHEKVEDFLLLGSAYRLSLFEHPSLEDKKKVDEVLELFNLSHLKECFMDELSGGEVQLLYVARCFIDKHKVLLLDEPCAHLDYHKQYTFLKRIKELVERYHMGAIVSIHDPNLALLFADRILLLHDKKVCYDKKIETKVDKKDAACIWNEVYGNHFLIHEDDEVYMHWKRDEGEVIVCLE